jgi:hypothetical protein
MPLRYAILHHTGVPEPHYDLLFETYPGSNLSTWRSPVWPIEHSTSVTRLKDHRRVYLDYTGEVSGGRGHVDRVAGGECEVEVGEDGNWFVRLLSGTPTTVLRLCCGPGQEWNATPLPPKP